jgi:hypothetical protein
MHTSELEISTSAFLFLTILTSAFWWTKPADLRLQTVLTPTAEHSAENTTVLDALANGMGDEGKLTRFAPTIADWSFHPLAEEVYNPSKPLKHYGTWRLVDPGAYPDESEELINFTILLTPIFAFVFGGFHLLAWSFEFPTPWEQALWRGAALVMTVAPAVGLVLLLVVRRFERSRERGRRKTGVVAVLSLVTFAYIMCRMVLTEQALAGLREMPVDVYKTLRWLEDIWHI